jgi:hypothetical protein
MTLINDESNSTNGHLNNVFENENVLRYDSYAYCKKYGEKWKQLANSVRDVPQEDGSIIREYVIEDPSLLEQLSEDEDDTQDYDQSDKSSSEYSDDNFQLRNSNSNGNMSYVLPNKNCINSNTIKSRINIQNVNKLDSNSTAYVQNRHAASVIDQHSVDVLGRPPLPDSVFKRSVSNTKPTQQMDTSELFPVLVQSISKPFYDTKHHNEADKLQNFELGKKSNTTNKPLDDDTDRELEKIHEAGKQNE